MSFYIVMQGRTYIEEKQHGIIWSPHFDKTGNTPHSWARMQEVKTGDCIFHYVKGEIVAMSMATSNCHEALNPYSDDQSTIGWQVTTNYEEFEHSLNIKEHFTKIQPLLPLKYAAFQDNSDGNQGYLYPCNEHLAIQLLEIISDLNIYEQEQEQLEFSIGTVLAKERETLRPLLTENEAAAKSKLRKGQHKFYTALSSVWEHQCALCDIALPELLRASYAKPWKDSTPEERLEAYNGLLLCRNHDTLYKQGYIAFDGTGRIHISPRIAEEDYIKLGIHPKMRVQRVEQHKPYFKWHKKNILR